MVEKMVKIVGNIFVLLLSLFVTCLDARVTMEIRTDGGDKNQVIVGQPFTLEVVIDDVYGSVQAPIIKGLDCCVSRLSGTYMSSINGKSTTRYSYNVRIDKLGTHIIGPAIVRHQQQELISNQLQVSVVKDLGIAAQTNKGSGNTSTKAFLRLMVDTETPFVGQRMGCTLRFYYQDSTISLQTVSIPELSGFDVKEIGKVETGTAEIDGSQYRYAQWRWDMYPTKPGEFIIPAYSADYDIPLKDNGGHLLSGFFMLMGNRADRKRVYSNAVTVKVSPLPHYKGAVDAVGSFERISADIKPGIAKEGEGMVLTIELEGTGNLQAIATPKLHMPDALKYYDSNSAIIAPRYADELPKKRFEFIVQAMKSGEYEIPEQLFTYFDVERHAYITLRTSPLAVSIMPGAVSTKRDITNHAATTTASSFAEASADKQADELGDINKTGQWYPVARRNPLPWWLFGLLFFLPCVYVMYPWVSDRLIVLTGNSVRLARRRALKHARKRIEQCIKNNNDKELYAIFTELLPHVHEKNDIRLVAEWNDFFERITHAAYAQSDDKKTEELCGMAKQWLERI